MKKILILLLLIAPLSLFAQTTAPKFGYIDVNAIMVLMPEFTKAQTELQALGKQYEDEYVGLRTEFEKKSLEFEQLQDSLPENLLKRRQEDLQNLYLRMQNYERETYQYMQQQQQVKLGEVAKILNDAIQAVGTDGGYVCIYDISNGTMPFVNTAICEDLSNKVKAKLGISLTAK